MKIKLLALTSTLTENGERERTVGFPIEVERSRVMNCDHQQMVNMTRELLSRRGPTISRHGAPGHQAVENYR